MKFSHDELLCFNSITKGPEPFGIKIKKSPDDNGTVLKRTQEQLREKQILDGEDHLTREGAVIVRCYEWYRNCETHLIINTLRVALLDNGECILLYPLEGGYEIQCSDHTRLMAAMLQESPYMRKPEGGSEKSKWKDRPYDEWSVFMEKEIKGSLMIGEYEGYKTVRERIFAWTEEQGYTYNLNRERCKQTPPLEMRIELLKVLKLWERQEEIRKWAAGV